MYETMTETFYDALLSGVLFITFGMISNVTITCPDTL